MKHPIEKVVLALLGSGAHTATAFLAPGLVIRATHVRFRKGSRITRKPSRTSVELTIGKPNANAWRFIRLLIKAGERFPVRKIRLQGKMVVPASRK